MEMHNLTTPNEIEDARRFLSELLESRGEWFRSDRPESRSVSLRRGEWELRVGRRCLLFRFWSDAGASTWRIGAWKLDGEKLVLEAVGRKQSAPARLELVPRASARVARSVVVDARLAESFRMARMVRLTFPKARLLRVGLSPGAKRGDPGRYARIVLRENGITVLATGPVLPLGADNVESFICSALLWFTRVEARTAMPGRSRLLFLAQKKLAEAACERIALLRDGLRKAVAVYELDGDDERLKMMRMRQLEELLASSPRSLKRAPRFDFAEIAETIVALDPEAIDVVRSRGGETLRYHGLPFARVRSLNGQEHLWFGVEAAPRKRLLDDSNWPELLKLLEDLREYRRADGDDPQERAHALYRAAPEAWLESILRRDVSRLDPGLRLAPLHAQFRLSRSIGGSAGSRPVDLLALRHDGRLAVIELKVSEDMGLALQAADYWRRIASHHRAGNIARARLFDDAPITNDPPLVYIVAPMLRYHRSFQTLARAINPAIEMYRFDLNEDWRNGVRVARRSRVT
jgi:hypothetical protein